MIWPEQMHVPPTAVSLAAKVLCGHPVLTSDIALASMFWRQDSGRHIETLDDLSDAAESFGLEPTAGELIAATRTRYTLRRVDERAGEVFVHFPRIGFILKKVD